MRLNFYMNNRFVTKSLIALFLIFFLLHLQSPNAKASQNLPTVKLQKTVEQVLVLLADDSYTSDPLARRQKILDVIAHRFNFSLMSRLALGDTWSELSGSEKDRFTVLFSELLKNTYVKRVEAYSDEKIIFTKETVKKNLAKVYSVFKKNNDEYSIIYKLRDEKGEWLVYDVIIEGASIVKQYRRQFSRIIEEEKFEGLMVRLDDKVKLLTEI